MQEVCRAWSRRNLLGTYVGMRGQTGERRAVEDVVAVG